MRDGTRVTMRDVAAAAGVSVPTVSRVLNGAATVDPELSARVRKAADRLGYRPNAIARALRSSVSHTFGLVVPDIANPFFPRLVKAIEQRLRGSGYVLLLADAQNDVAVEREVIADLLQRSVDGLLVSPCDRERSASAMLAAAAEIPVVQIDRHATAELPWVGADQWGAIHDVLLHLVAAGVRRPAFIGPLTTESPALERLRAFAEVAVRELEGWDRPTFTCPSDVAAARALTGEILATRPDIDALVCGNDVIAFGALEICRRAGRSDIAVTGFDETFLAEASGLTSVEQPLAALADTAIRLCLGEGGEAGDGTDGAEGEGRREQVRHACRVVARGSTTSGATV
ncbi:LacI family DNA-binding transcriptional regulator [Microbispora sp. CA-102843]|uniref:LacI family DNA-binding transcriptional regulator n=1 Tax=Microbispora sp. CA-102843 TaxID=3239952 RepID=UPI003D937C6A